MSAETRKRALAKTLSWRLVATTTTAVLAWAITGSVAAGLTIGGAEAIAKMMLYYAHERVWARA